MAKAKKLASGSWRCLVYDKTVDGKRIYKSFTSTDTSSKGKREAEMLAAEYALTKESSKNYLTFQEALQKYITSRESILSVSTIRGYSRSAKNDFKTIDNLDINKITQQDIQKLVNEKSKTSSPKTVRNMHGIISAVLKEFRPEFHLTTSLPQKMNPELYIPTDSEVMKLIECVNDEDMLIAIYLAAFGPMRRSEICGLTSDYVKNGVVHVKQVVVHDKDNNWILKEVPKTDAGDRLIPLPGFVFDLIANKKGKIVELNPDSVTDKFERILKRSGLHHFRFHDLRHYCASRLHALGIPDAYIMQRGGWDSDIVLKKIYRHALSDESVKMNDIANNHFDTLCNMKYNMK